MIWKKSSNNREGYIFLFGVFYVFAFAMSFGRFLNDEFLLLSAIITVPVLILLIRKIRKLESEGNKQ